MKKNVMMRVASLLMVCVLATTCGISGTFAKYVTSGEATDSARVAKWGVKVQADYSNLFEDEYATTVAWTGDDGVSVQASEDVVAPGTFGILADFAVSGTPEVDVEVTYEADLNIGDKWFVCSSNNDVEDVAWVADTFYCPITITVNGVPFCGLDYTTAAAFEADVEDQIATSAKKYNVGATLTDSIKADLDVDWKWDFVGSTEGGSGHEKQLNKYDTQLGDRAAAGKAATISLTVECTVSQID